jgi:hypothetical protein
MPDFSAYRRRRNGLKIRGKLWFSFLNINFSALSIITDRLWAINYLLFIDLPE